MSAISRPTRRFSPARLAAFRAVETACRWAGGRAFYRARFLSPPRLRVRRERVEIAGLAPELDGFKIAQLSDFHGGPFLRARDLACVIDATNALEPDAVALTGDFATHRADEAIEIAPAFGALRARRGVFAVFGNHDYKRRRDGEIARALEAQRVRVLRNEHVEAAPGLVIAGIEDLEEGKPSDLDAALAGIEARATVVLLSHHPGGAGFASRRGVALVLSGHTHGGQIRWPLLRRLGPPHPGDRLRVGGTTLLVSHGVGAVGVPFRSGSRAEIVLATLARAPRE